MAPAPQLTELIATVDADAASTDPLARLSTASTIAAELTDTSDALVGHYVDECRAAGRTWAEISEALGVSKQAAHKRYSMLPPRPQPLHHPGTGRHQPQRRCRSGPRAGYVGTEHILLGLFPPGGIAATLLTESGLTQAKVAMAIQAASPGGDSTVADPPFTPRAAEVFSGALSEALAMGHNYIGTEHLVLALFRDPEGLAAKILAEAGITKAGYHDKIVKMLVGLGQKK